MKTRLSGFTEAIKAVSGLPKGIRRRGVRSALKAGGEELKSEVKKRTPKDTGLLKTSMGLKVSVPSNERDASVKVGARRGFKRQVEKNKRGKLKLVAKKTAGLLPPSAATVWRNPTRYSHLVERKTHFHERALVASSGRVSDQIANKLQAMVLTYRT